MPPATGVVQLAGKPPRPSISTRQTRQLPNASNMSVAQSFGTDLPAFAAASMTELPAGTETSTPSTVRVTLGPSRGGVPVSMSSLSSRNSAHTMAYSSLSCLCRQPANYLAFILLQSNSLQALSLGAEILGEMGECAHDGVGCEAAKRAQRSELHGVAEVLEHDQILAPVLAGNDLVHQLDATDRANAARRALAAGFEGAE